jgi:guanosine-3',5'-bis(diphosphate) 3'-pyrophosphohydrolase
MAHSPPHAAMPDAPLPDDPVSARLLAAAHFAAVAHRAQRRKGEAQDPYINHPLEVAHLLASVGGVTDPMTLLAAILHDTVEDTDVTPADLVARFGQAVADVVAEVTDDKSLPKAERKRLQVEHGPHLSAAAKRVKLADKICNITSIATAPPPDWPLARRAEYLDWAERVVAGLRGCSPPLEALFDERLAEGRRVLRSS